jgi:histidine triad (HIT) family protein
MRAPDCVFCKIVERTADALVIHEDDHIISFLPLEPAVAGHTLVVPKAHHADIYTIPADLLSALVVSCQLHARRWREHAGATGFNILHASGVDGEQSVAHFHFHVLPRFSGDGLQTWPSLPRPRQTREQMHAAFRIEP